MAPLWLRGYFSSFLFPEMIFGIFLSGGDITELCRISTRSTASSKYKQGVKNTKQYYTPKSLITYL